MEFLAIIFWLSLAILFYSYIGYGIVVFGLLKMRRLLNSEKDEQKNEELNYEPEVTLLVAAYNERDCIDEKVENSVQLEYPKDKLKIVFITDGSTDGTPDELGKFDRVTVLHEDKRAGKIGAINRAMNFVDTPIVVFSDANTMFNKSAIRELVKHYQHPNVGAVSGEKRIKQMDMDSASGAGEGLYWKYESFLKKLDSDLYSIVGAAGEMFSIRTELFEEVEGDTILDDFIISLRIAEKGFRVVYEPNAYALETPSSSIKEEMKRKVRISAGGFQSIARLKGLLNPLKYGMLSFQYISHRVLRWAVNPFLLVALIPINFALMISFGGIYTTLFGAQIIFYGMTFSNWYFETKNLRIKLLFVPFYFSMMNLAAILGFFRYVRGRQSVLWERASRI